MIFNGMMKTDAFFFRTENSDNDQCFVEMERDCEIGTFSVCISCDDEWEWRFYDRASNYELVKHAIIDIALDAKNEDDLINGMDDIFSEYFDSIVACKCDNGCGNCNCK